MTAKYPEIFVLRHGQTVWNAKARFQGRGNSGLTDLGRQQAATQGAILRAPGTTTRALPGGQGCVYHMVDGDMHKLEQ